MRNTWSGGETRKFYRNMQYERSARQLAITLLAFMPVLLPIFVIVALVFGFKEHPHATAMIHGQHVQIQMAAAAAAAAPAISSTSQSKANIHALLARATRDQGPEFEQTLTWANTTVLTTPTSLRTDRKISFFDLHFRGRITNAAAPGTYRAGPSLLGTPLFSLIQQITIRGQHFRYGSQAPIQMTGETAAEYMALVYPNYSPTFSVSVNGGALVKSAALVNTASATQDIDFVLPICLYPPDISGGDIPFYCLHGPDWAGNIYMDIKTADQTALGVTLVQTTGPTAFGSTTGSASLEINSERPLISKDFMSKIRPAIMFRTTNAQQPTATVSGVSGSGLKLADLTVGKDTCRIFAKFGTALAATTGGVTAFGTLSDQIATRTFFSMDVRGLRFQNANGDSVLQDYLGRKYGRTIPAGYRMMEFVSTMGPAPANPKAAFPSSKLTAARKFELDADVTAAANQIAEVVQEMLLGRPGLSS
jgi:hypothetical protein